MKLSWKLSLYLITVSCWIETQKAIEIVDTPVSEKIQEVKITKRRRARLSPTPIIQTMNLDDIGIPVTWEVKTGIEDVTTTISPVPALQETTVVSIKEKQKSAPAMSEPLPQPSDLPIEINQNSTQPQADIQDRVEAAKRESAKKLVESAALFLQNNSEQVAFSLFTHDKKFRIGDIYLFVYDLDGICLAQGEQLSSGVWDNDYALKDQFGVLILQEILQEAQHPKNDGWVTYQWRNSTKRSYVKEVVKNNQVYIIGAGYYPHSKQDAVVGLVKGAVALFYDVIKNGLPVEAAFSVMSYPKGRFVLGDLYLYALDFNGLIVAHGERFGAINTNELDYKDAQGVMINREIIRKLREKGTGIWLDYQSKGARKKAYAERVVDAQGKEYFIACGYYPDSIRHQVTELVSKAAYYLDQHGESQAVREFSKRQTSSAFIIGDLYIALFDMDGFCLAHGGNEELAGKNLSNELDEHNVLYIQELIKKAQSGGGWVDYKIKNAFFSAYVEKVEVGLKNYVVTSGIFPISTFETQVLLVKSALSELQKHPLKIACGTFINPESKFVRGDLGIFIMNTDGTFYVYKDRSDLVWKNLINAQDDRGKPYVKMFIEQALKAPGAVTYNLLNAQVVTYVEAITKDGKTYIVGSESYR